MGGVPWTLNVYSAHALCFRKPLWDWVLVWRFNAEGVLSDHFLAKEATKRRRSTEDGGMTE